MTLSAATSKTAAGRGNLGADQQAGQRRGGIVWLEVVEQRRGADAEERGSDVAALPERAAAGGEEDGVVRQGRRCAFAERMAQDRLFGQDGKQLAGQPGLEAGNDAVCASTHFE